ncbi:Cyclin-like F-box [Penicillium camemberti]|uniref:Cyclin-like F-box n=1 Tax=Penicillium camemberti (strain FM 013) TaxID=1429867 RepID=A0A0G4NUF8_PENC3|nr:Cyclin-like F-box [Penicillium camemberti]
MSLSHLPTELIDIIVKFLPEGRYLNSLAQTCWRLHLLLNPILYQTSVRTSHGFPLVWAAEHSSEVTIRQAFDAGASTHSCHYNLHRSLVAAVTNSHETIVRLILEQNKDKDPSVFIKKENCKLCGDQGSYANPSENKPPLYFAAVRGNVTIVKLLLAYNITFELDHRHDGPIGFDFVLAALKNGHLAVLQVFLEAGYDLNDEEGGYWNKTPLYVAVHQGHAKLVEYLLDKGAKPSCEEEPSLTTAARKGHLETVKLLLKRGADPRAHPWALSCAASEGHVKVVEVLLEHGAGLDLDTDEGWKGTLYDIAVSGRLKILHLLLAHGVDIYPKEPKEKCDLLSSIIGNKHWRRVGRQKRAAFAKDFRTIVDFENMIAHGDDEAQAQVLYIAIGYGWDDIVQRVLQQGFSAEGVYLRNEAQYDRPILQAVDNGHIGITKLLVEHGANIQEYQGEDTEEGALPLAIQLGNVQIAELLIDHGADVNCLSSRGETALAEAAAGGAKASADMFRMLLDRGADPTKTPLHADENAITRALYFGAVDAVQTLVERGIALEMPPLPKRQKIRKHHRGLFYPKTPKKLIEEAFLGGEEMAELVLDRGLLIIDPESTEAQEGLEHAVQFRMAGVVKRLLGRGVDPKLSSSYLRPSLLVAAAYCPSTNDIVNATAILDMLLAHGADIEQRSFPGMAPLYRTIVQINAHAQWVFGQTEVRLLLERGADPFAEHDRWNLDVTETRDGHAYSDSLFMNRRSLHNANAWSDDSLPRKMVRFRRDSLSGQGDDPFLACMRRGNKAVLKLMIEAIDRKRIPLEELKERLDRARIEATENGNLHLLPILEDYYWTKRYPCK